MQLALGLDYLRYAFDFNPVPAANATLAGGATDQYLSAWLGVEFHYASAPGPVRNAKHSARESASRD